MWPKSLTHYGKHSLKYTLSAITQMLMIISGLHGFYCHSWGPKSVALSAPPYPPHGWPCWTVSFCTFYESFFVAWQILPLLKHVHCGSTLPLLWHRPQPLITWCVRQQCAYPYASCGSSYKCHMWVHTEITTLVPQLTSINAHLWWQFPVKIKCPPSSCLLKQTPFQTHGSLHYLTWLKKLQLTVETEGCRDLERRGRRQRSQYESPTPKDFDHSGPLTHK